MKKFIKYHLPAILYAGLIIFVSSLRNLPSPDTGMIPFDKIAHFMEYAVFSVLIFRSFANISSMKNKKLSFLISFLFLILFAFLDETFQRYIPGRTSDLIDILSDTLGAALVLTILYIYQSKKKLITNTD